MGDDSFILMNLKDSKEVAAAMQNDTAQKILDFLTKGKATESIIAKELGIPLSTVHYNLQQLLKAKLVLADEYHYSKKGKEILHYKLAKKLIIIAPGGDESTWKNLLKKVIPAFGITAAIGYVVNFFVQKSANNLEFAAKTLAQAEVAPMADVMVRSMPSEEMVAGAANLVANNVSNASSEFMAASPELYSNTFLQEPSFWSQISGFEWFTLGAISIVAILLIIELVSHKKWFKSKKH